MSALSNRFLLALLAAFILVSVNASAGQDRERNGDRPERHGPPDAEMRVAKMTQQLDLSDEQSADLLVVMQGLDIERNALREEMQAQMEPELCRLQISTEREIATILTAEQLIQLEEKKGQRDGKRRGRRGMENLDCSAYE